MIIRAKSTCYISTSDTDSAITTLSSDEEGLKIAEGQVYNVFDVEYNDYSVVLSFSLDKDYLVYLARVKFLDLFEIIEME